jgi:DNA (cytosine-5)-methyltransferase 1
VLLENVANLSDHDGGRTFTTIIHNLKGAGYNVSHSVLDSSHFGLPQRRKRLYIVAIRKDLGLKFTFPVPRRTTTRIADVLEAHVNKKYTLSTSALRWHEEHAKKQEAKGNGYKYRLFERWAEATCTITARYSSDGSRALILQSEENPRRLTPREVARLQGFPDSYKLVVSDNQAYRQFGNAVSVPVVRAICRELVSPKAFRQGVRSRAKRRSKFQK